MGKMTLNPNIGVSTSDTDAPRRLHLDRMRTVEVESRHGSVSRVDSYMLETNPPIVRRKGNEVQVHAVHWAKARNATVDVRWSGTGLSFWEVNQIRIYSWPEGALMQVQEDLE